MMGLVQRMMGLVQRMNVHLSLHAMNFLMMSFLRDHPDRVSYDLQIHHRLQGFRMKTIRFQSDRMLG